MYLSAYTNTLIHQFTYTYIHKYTHIRTPAPDQLPHIRVCSSPPFLGHNSRESIYTVYRVRYGIQYIGYVMIVYRVRYGVKGRYGIYRRSMLVW